MMIRSVIRRILVGKNLRETAQMPPSIYILPLLTLILKIYKQHQV